MPYKMTAPAIAMCRIYIYEAGWGLGLFHGTERNGTRV